MRRSANFLIGLTLMTSVFVCTGCQGPYKPPGEKLPDGFIINCYPKSTCTRADSTPMPGNKRQDVVVLLTDDDVYKVKSWYSTEVVLKGYRVLSDNEVKGAITLECEGDKNHVTVTMSPLGDKTIISISVLPKLQ